MLSKTLSKMSMASGLSTHKTMAILDWFMEPQFYLVACIYMSARLFVNVSQSYITFYVQYTVTHTDAIKLEWSTMIALIPMIIFLSGFIVSMVLKFITDKFGHKIAFIGSCVVGLCKLMSGFSFGFLGHIKSTVPMSNFNYHIFISTRRMYLGFVWL